MNDFAATLTSFANFFGAAAQVSGALVGLVFVALTYNSRLLGDGGHAGLRALAQQVREVKPVDNMRTWFHSFFAVLRLRSGSRHFSLRTLLYRPNATLRSLAAPSTVHTARNPRRPRRMTSGSAGWFGFAMR